MGRPSMSILPLASVVLVVLLPSLPVIWNWIPSTLPSSEVLTRLVVYAYHCAA